MASSCSSRTRRRRGVEYRSSRPSEARAKIHTPRPVNDAMWQLPLYQPTLVVIGPGVRRDDARFAGQWLPKWGRVVHLRSMTPPQRLPPSLTPPHTGLNAVLDGPETV